MRSRRMCGRSSCSKRPAGSIARSRDWSRARSCCGASRSNRGLTRPELAVVLSISKLVLQDAAEELELSDDPLMEPELFDAFPKPMRKAQADAIRSHRLRNEIIATKVANRLVNRLGPGHRVRHDRGGRRFAAAGRIGVPRRRAAARSREAVAADRGGRRFPRRSASSCSRSRRKASEPIFRTCSRGGGRRSAHLGSLRHARARRPQDFRGGRPSSSAPRFATRRRRGATGCCRSARARTSFAALSVFTSSTACSELPRSRRARSSTSSE